MNRTYRFELSTAVIALALALIAGIYLAASTFASHETCYGISSARIQCHPLAPESVGPTLGRLAVSLSIVLVLYIGGALGAWWQTRASAPDARSTAFGVLGTCALTVLGLTISAIDGVGFFFLPSAIVLAIAGIAGLVAMVQGRKSVPTT